MAKFFSLISAEERGLQGGVVGGFSLYDREGSLKLFLSSHDRERDKALLRATLAWRCLERFLLGRMRGEPVLCRLYGGTDGDFHLFRECTSPSSLWFISGRILNSLHWPLRTRVLGLDLCFGTVGVLVFLVMLAFPWALSDADVARERLDAALGGYPPDLWVLG